MYSRYLESKRHRWNKDHSMLVKDIVNVNHMNIDVCHPHHKLSEPRRMNIRISDLFLELKKIFEELHINYHFLHQEVYLKRIDLAPPAFPTIRH